MPKGGFIPPGLCPRVGYSLFLHPEVVYSRFYTLRWVSPWFKEGLGEGQEPRREEREGVRVNVVVEHPCGLINNVQNVRIRRPRAQGGEVCDTPMRRLLPLIINFNV